MSRQEYDPSRGRIKRTVLFHTMEEGVVTASTLTALTGLSTDSTQGALIRLREAGLLGWAADEVMPTTDRRVSGHALTKKGIEAALRIDPSEVIFAKAEAAGVPA